MISFMSAELGLINFTRYQATGNILPCSILRYQFHDKGNQDGR